jgi:anaerobic ribonucleoside-triphosphate reductase activating protein
MRYSKIREMDVSNGEGLGISLFVQGCHFHCRGCFNPETWDFSGGKEWNKQVEQQFLHLASKPYINRISILGGEPLCDENVLYVCDLVDKLKQLYPDKKIWVYTGYKYEDIINLSVPFYKQNWNDINRIKLVHMVDVLVDGQFQLENQDLYNEHIVWAGSTNQRVIDIPATLSDGKIHIYNSK